jgi:tripartite-type tricarboxylate transporter receptor subunit TctC
MQRRVSVAFVALAATMLAGAGPAFAQSYPTRPVKVVVPFAPGGPLDFVGRAVFDKLSASLKQPFIMENRTGAGGNIGTEAVAKAAPDGYTLLLVLSGTLTANPAMYHKLPFNVEKDLRPITLLTTNSQMMVVHPSLPVNTLAELVAYAKKQPLTYAPCRTRQRRPSRDGISPHHGRL